jgi:hypothetical protein
MKDARPNLFSIASVALEKSNLQAAALIVINARVGSAAVVETGRESSDTESTSQPHVKA